MKNKIITICFIIYIFSFSIIGLVLKDKEISTTERRYLKKFPSFELDSNYITNVDKYFLDHFPFRNNFRSIKANFNYNFLFKLDNNNIYLKNDYIFKAEYPTNYKSIEKFITTINKIKSTLNENNKIYILTVPDKNYYLDEKLFLNIDYEYIYNEIDKLNITNIDIRNIMNLSDYYQTDTHWKQEKLDKVVKEISMFMNFEYEETTYENKVFDNFYGVYYGESALNRKPEKLTYLINEDIEGAEVKYLENNKLTSVYNFENLDSFDAYEVFLDGASSFIEITNKNSLSNKELVVFRDSFGSSLTPLLIKYYSKITLIDNRYISSNDYKNLIEFTDQDVLFLYSTLIINNSSTLKG